MTYSLRHIHRGLTLSGPDRIESKLDKLLEIANRPLPDGMQRAE